MQAGCVCVLLPRGRAAQALVNRAEAPRQMADGSLAELLAESSQGSQSSVEFSSGSQTPDRLRDWDSASSSDDGEDLYSDFDIPPGSNVIPADRKAFFERRKNEFFFEKGEDEQGEYFLRATNFTTSTSLELLEEDPAPYEVTRAADGAKMWFCRGELELAPLRPSSWRRRGWQNWNCNSKARPTRRRRKF